MAFPTPYDYQRHKTHAGITAAEYMAIEEYTERRHEFIYGDMIWLPDITLLHSRIKTNIWMTLHKQFDNTSFESFGGMLKIEAVKDKVILYPGFAAAKEANQHPDSYFIQEPILIGEMLTPVTGDYNKEEKFSYYKNIPSLQYYMLVELEEPSVWLHSKAADESWHSDFYSSLSEAIQLPLLDTILSLSDIYED